jgi:hypothetical protein
MVFMGLGFRTRRRSIQDVMRSRCEAVKFNTLCGVAAASVGGPAFGSIQAQIHVAREYFRTFDCLDG